MHILFISKACIKSNKQGNKIFVDSKNILPFCSLIHYKKGEKKQYLLISFISPQTIHKRQSNTVNIKERKRQRLLPLGQSCIIFHHYLHALGPYLSIQQFESSLFL
jgi:hypothetical protein